MMRKLTKTVVAAVTCTMAPVALASAGQPSGKDLYTQKNCHTCHGPEGKVPTLSLYPKLAGQSADYMVNQIKYIKTGQRNTGMSMTMKPFVMTLSDAESHAISTYLQNVKP